MSAKGSGKPQNEEEAYCYWLNGPMVESQVEKKKKIAALLQNDSIKIVPEASSISRLLMLRFTQLPEQMYSCKSVTSLRPSNN